MNNDDILPLNRTVVAEEVHPSTGRRPYSQDLRITVMSTVNNNPQALHSPHIIAQQEAHTFPSTRTIQRWTQREQQLGHFLPFRATGNRRGQREIRHQDLVELSLYRKVHPKAFGYEVAAHLFNRNLANGHPHSDSQICRAENLLKLRLKKGSTTSYKAYLPRNLNLRDMYFTCPYPLGIADVNIADLIDLDEMGLKLEHSDRSFGKTLQGDRCDAPGAFENCLPKQNTLAGISADPYDPMRWIEIWTGEGTTVYRFVLFIRRICGDLNERHPGRSFCFTMDNLNVHKNPLVVQEILQSGHRLVFRAPYWSVDGAIEYVFCTVHTGLLTHYNAVNSMAELEHYTLAVFGAIPTFTPYFRHIGA
jgi:hypothetical protein